MGGDNGNTAMLWRNEFRKKKIGYDDIVVIGNNLSELNKPDFIPNVFQLIEIVSNLRNDPHKLNNQMYKSIEELKSDKTVYLLKTGKELQDLRDRTKTSAESSIAKMRDFLK